MHTHIPSATELRRLLEDARARGLSARAMERLQWLLHYVEQGKSVSATCRHFGITRITFYRLLHRFNAHDLRTLENQPPRLRTMHHSALPADVLMLIRRYRQESPQMGKEKIAQLLGSEHKVFLSPSAVGRAIAREGLYFGDTPLHVRKRRELQGGALSSLTAEAVSEKRLADSGELFAGMQDTSATHYPLPATRFSKHHCVFCRAWPLFKRSLIVVCVLSNIAFIGLSLLTTVWESKETVQVKATVLPYTDTFLAPLE